MFIELLIVAVQALCLTVIICVISVIIVNYLAVQKFRRKTPSIPIAPNRNLFISHGGDISYRRGTLKISEENHAKLGKTFAWFLMEKPAVSTIDLDFIKRMVLDDPNANINRSAIPNPIHEISEDSISYCHGAQWRRLRRVYASALSEHKIKSPNVQDEISSVKDRFVDSLDWRLGEKSELEINLDDLCCRWSLDQALTSFFKQPDTIDYKAKEDYCVHMLERGLGSIVNPFVVFGATFRVFHKVADWLAMRLHFTGKCRTQLKSLVIKQAVLNSKARAEAKAEADKKGSMSFDFEKLDSYNMNDGVKFRRNIADFIIDRLEDGTMSNREYLHSTMFLFLAAGKTGSDASTFIIYILAKHPEVQNKLRASLLEEGLKSEYLTWVIHESIRLGAPVNGGCDREISSDLYTSDGMLVPKGTRVFTPNNVIHRLKEYWGADANEFKPERWAHAKNFHPCQYLGFGLGKRRCPGEKFAMETLKTLLNALLQRYKFHSSPRSSEWCIKMTPLFVYHIMERPTYVKFSRLKSANKVAN